VPEDFLDHGALVNDRNDAHGVLTPRADERGGVPDLRDDGAQGTEAGLVVVRLGGDERGEVAVGALPEGRLFRMAGVIEVHGEESPLGGLKCIWHENPDDG